MTDRRAFGRPHACIRRAVTLSAVIPVLFALAAGGPVTAGDLVNFISPSADDIVLGPTLIRLAVRGGERLVDRVDLYVEGRLIGTALPPEWSCTWDAGTEKSGAGIVAVVYADGEMLGKVRLNTRQFYFGEAIDVAVVQLYPVVTDRRGRYVKDLTRDDFRVIDQGRPVDIEYFATEVTSLSIAIVLDVSESMEEKLDAVQEASCDFVDRLGPGDRVSVYAFNQGLRRVLAPTGDHEAVKDGIRGLRAAGGTALYDALAGVLEEMGSEAGRRAVFLFSDGLDELSATTLEGAVAAARNSEAIIYTVGAGRDKRSLAAREDLCLLAEETGGSAGFIERMRDLPQAFATVLSDLRAQYVLSYPSPKGPPGVRSLAVRCRDRSLRVRCRKSYLHARGS